MSGRIISLVAIPLSLIGHLLFWMGSARLLLGSQVLAPIEPGYAVAAFAGIALIAAAVATVAVGSLGVIVTGAVQLAFTLLLFAIPFGVQGGFSPAFEIMNAVRAAGTEVGDGLFFYVPTGIAFVTGAIMLVAGLAARARRRTAPVEVRVGAGVIGVLAVVGVLMAVAGGARLYTRLFVMFGGLDPVGLIVLIVGTLLVAGAVLIGRWTSLAALVAGGVTTLAGLVALASPSTLFRASADWPELRRGLDLAGPSGTLLLIGVLLVIAGLALRVRGRREAVAAGMVPPAQGQEPPPPSGLPSV